MHYLKHLLGVVEPFFRVHVLTVVIFKTQRIPISMFCNKRIVVFRLFKDDAIFNALGAVDTLSSHIGLSRVYCKQDVISQDLKSIQCNLQDIGMTSSHYKDIF